MVPLDLVFNFVFEFRASSLAEAVAMLAVGARTCSWPRVIGVVSPMRAKPTKSAKPVLPDVVALLDAPTWIAETSFKLQFGELSSLSMGFNGDTANGTINLAVKDALSDDPAAYLAPIIAVTRELMREDVLTKADLTRYGDDRNGCVPAPPIALRREPFAVTTLAEIAEHYEDVDAFLELWEIYELWGEHDDKILLARCTENPIDRAAILENTQHRQWDLARIAKPGKTFYSDPVVHPDEEKLYKEYPRRLEHVGTRDGLTEYSCVLSDPDDHIAGYEIYELRALAKTGGTVRVVFLDQWMAKQEKRPLLDNGIRVYYGDDVEITV